jgi:hypothetical protein
MSDAPRIALYVFDTGPLITLAAAESLDYLLYPSVTVVIPDAVFYEATRESGKLGAQSIIDWVKLNHDKVELAVTRSFIAFQAAHDNDPTFRMTNLGEQAAVEVIEEPARLQGNELAVLLCEETTVLKRIRVNQPDKIVEITTMDFLIALEKYHRIQSADAVFDLAIAAGRNPSRVEKFSQHAPEIRDAVRETLELFKKRGIDR